MTDDNGGGIPGVSVVLKGTTTGTATDANGNYALSLPDGTGTLVFSYIGYTAEEIPVNNQTVIDVVLLPDISLTVQVLSFLAISVFSALLLRRPMLEKFRSLRPPRKVDNITGETALILETIAPGSEGEAELRGTRWTARNIGDCPLDASGHYTVDHIEGLMLCIRAK